MRHGLPAFLPESDPAGAFHEMYLRRDELYAGYADVTVDVENLDADSAYGKLTRAIQERIDVRQ